MVTGGKVLLNPEERRRACKISFSFSLITADDSHGDGDTKIY